MPMERIFSVDLALELQAPRVELRGVRYHCRSTTTKDRIILITSYLVAEAKAISNTDRGQEMDEAGWDGVEDVKASVVKGLLEDVPDDVASGLSELEFKALLVQVQAAMTADFLPARGTMTDPAPVPTRQEKKKAEASTS